MLWLIVTCIIWCLILFVVLRAVWKHRKRPYQPVIDHEYQPTIYHENRPTMKNDKWKEQRLEERRERRVSAIRKREEPNNRKYVTREREEDWGDDEEDDDKEEIDVPQYKFKGWDRRRRYRVLYLPEGPVAVDYTQLLHDLRLMFPISIIENEIVFDSGEGLSFGPDDVTLPLTYDRSLEMEWNQRPFSIDVYIPG